MKSLVVALSVLVGVNAFARRTYVSCDEGKRTKSQYTARANFNPDLALETNWKRENGRATLMTYKPGSSDEGYSTTARVNLGFPQGRVSIAEFYTVNVFGTQGYDVDAGPFRTFHGLDKNQQFDVILYLSDSGLKENSESFQGRLTYQSTRVDQGYVQVNLVCSARVQD